MTLQMNGLAWAFHNRKAFQMKNRIALAVLAVVMAVTTVGVIVPPTQAGASLATGNPASSPSVTAVGDTYTATTPQGLTISVKVPKTKVIRTGAAAAVAPVSVTQLNTPSGGLQFSQVIYGPRAPTSYSYKLSLPAGYSPYAQPNGTIALESDSLGRAGAAPVPASTLGFVSLAWAKDANGVPVPTSYSVVGDTITQWVNLSGVTAYPVVADPKITFGWDVYAFFSKQDLQAWLFTAIVDSVSGAAGAACGFLAEVPPAAVACAGLVVFVWDAAKHLFQTAIDRNGGIVLKFTYWGQWDGYLYAGSWS